MTLETLTDTRSMIDEHDFAGRVDVGSGVVIMGNLNREFDQTFGVNGQRTTLRVVNPDADLVTINQSITVLYEGAADEVYTVRAKERGQRSTILVLEVSG